MLVDTFDIKCRVRCFPIDGWSSVLASGSSCPTEQFCRKVFLPLGHKLSFLYINSFLIVFLPSKLLVFLVATTNMDWKQQQ